MKDSRCFQNAPLKEVLEAINAEPIGTAFLENKEGELTGVFTDGDLRRALDDKADVHTDTIASVMTQNPKTVAPEQLAYEAFELMQNHKITALLVVGENDQLVGALNIHDLFHAGIM